MNGPLDPGPEAVRPASRGGPFQASRPGCGGKGRTGPGYCGAEPTWIGLRYYTGSRKLTLAFACDEHAAELDVRRPVEQRDHAELERRRERDRAAIQGKQPYVPDPPIATGTEALRRLEAARRWYEQRPPDPGSP